MGTPRTGTNPATGPEKAETWQTSVSGPKACEWVIVILVLGFLIFFHELGHFLAALWMKVKVEEFGFGFPRAR